MNQLGREKKQAADPLRKYFGTGDINFKVDDKEKLRKAVEARYQDGMIDFLDGISVTYPTWWVNVRPSNTEPCLRMCLEADTKALMEQKRDELFAILGTPHDH